jgi:tungstate transport system substrate-binding protein
VKPLSPRRLAASVLAVGLTTALTTTLSAPAAHADDASTLTVVGTSDVYDSFLVQTVLKPGFEAAYPQYTLNYVSQGTDAAIAYAKSGQASAMIVHAAALENQFVAEGYSLESYGRAIFWGDFVFAGFTSDPAGIGTKGHGHDIVKSFEDVAAAGVAGDATFVSRGKAPGTTVQEHAIWAQTTGVDLCDISTAQGGGKAPTNHSGGTCGTSGDLPDWYKITEQSQGPNILTANACNSFSPRPADSCYVFTDRGTFNYLDSTNQVGNLDIVTRDNAATATGGPDLLVNSFHAYAINPAKFTSPSVSINTTAATAFLNWVTSPAGQTAVGNYLNGTNDAPFLPSAAPKVTTSALPASVDEGQSITVTGTLSNVVPGTPKLDFVPVKLLGAPAGGAATTVATATTDATGAYSLTYKPTATMAYTVATDQITKIQNATLNPVFGDLLAPTSTPVGTVQFKAAPVVEPEPGLKAGKVTVKVKEIGKKKVQFSGALTPKAGSKKAYVKVFVKKGKAKKFHSVAKVKLAKNAQKWSIRIALGKGKFTYYVKYVNPGASKPATSNEKKLKR